MYFLTLVLNPYGYVSLDFNAFACRKSIHVPMISLDAMLEATSTTEAVTCFLLLVRLIWIRMAFRYSGLAVLVGISPVVDIAAIILSPSSHVYYALFTSVTIIQVVALAIFAWQILSPLRTQYPGFIVLAKATLLRSSLLGLLFAATAIPATIGRWNTPAFQCWEFKLFEAARFIYTTLFIYLTFLGRLRRRHTESMNSAPFILAVQFYCAANVFSTMITYYVRNPATWYVSAFTMTLIPSVIYLYLTIRIVPEPTTLPEIHITHPDSDLRKQIGEFNAFILNELREPSRSAAHRTFIRLFRLRPHSS